MGSCLLLFFQILFFMLHALFPLLLGFQSQTIDLLVPESKLGNFGGKKKGTDCWLSGALNSDFPDLSTVYYVSAVYFSESCNSCFIHCFQIYSSI